MEGFSIYLIGLKRPMLYWYEHNVIYSYDCDETD